MKNISRRRLSAALMSLIMCVVMVAACVVPAAAVENGSWKSVKIKDGRSSCTVNAFVLSTPARNCKSFNLEMDVTMYANTSCKNWQIWIRSGGNFVKAATIYLPHGGGHGSKKVSFATGEYFDAVAITPTQFGSYSWSMDFEISNITSAPAKKSVESTPTTTVEWVNGSWESAELVDGSRSFDVSVFVFDKPLKGCTSFNFATEVTMRSNNSSKKWGIWVRSGGTFSLAKTFELADGSGYGHKKVKFNKPKDIDAVTIIPMENGYYSWDNSISVTNAVCQAEMRRDVFSGMLTGDWQKVKLVDGSKSYNVSALALDTPVRNCTGFDVTVNVSMAANTSCKDWQIWIRSGGTFIKAAKLYLPNGNGEASKTVRFSQPKRFDAIAITPTVPGSYSWGMGMIVYNAQYK